MGAVASILGIGGETSPKRVDSVVGKGGKVVPLQIKRADYAEEGERILNGLHSLTRELECQPKLSEIELS
jgi:hypothetical protein